MSLAQTVIDGNPPTEDELKAIVVANQPQIYAEVGLATLNAALDALEREKLLAAEFSARELIEMLDDHPETLEADYLRAQAERIVGLAHRLNRVKVQAAQDRRVRHQRAIRRRPRLARRGHHARSARRAHRAVSRVASGAGDGSDGPPPPRRGHAPLADVPFCGCFS